jgi:non-specific serine/threonine protein kinase/serine/threonine-protein kinase
MRTLEKDRSRRYGSPMDLAADIERHLKHEPVLASPPSALYLARKFVRRHTAGVGAAVAGLIVMVAFAGTMAVQANRIAAERDRANAEAERANREAEANGQVAEFLKDLFTVSDPGEARGNSITARELLDKGAEKIEQLEDDLTRAELMGTMGSVYLKLGLQAQAEPLLEQAFVERKRLLGNHHSDTLWSMNVLANLTRARGRYDEAERLYIDTIEGFTHVYGEDHRSTLIIIDNLACLYRDTGRPEEAEPLFLQAFEGLRRLLGADDPFSINVMHHLAHLYQDQGRYAEAEPLYLEAIEARKRVQGEDHWRTFESTANLAVMYTAQSRYDDAETLLLQTFEGRKRVFGAEHPGTTGILFHLARNEALRGDRMKAMDRLRQAVETGYPGAGRMARDPDLESLHGPEFDALVERARQNAEAKRAEE